MGKYSSPLLTVIVPVYNVGDYIEKCIRSILEQSFSDIEIILVDDGSTDNSVEICDKFAKNDKRVKVVHKENGGVLSARKEGVNIATGKYIIGVDGDDWIEKNRLEYLANQIYATEVDMVFMAGYWRDIQGKSRAVYSPIPHKIYFEQEILKEVFPLLMNTDKCFKTFIQGSLCMWAIKRELLKEKINQVDERISSAEDEICIWFCLLEANSVSTMKNLTYHYTQRSTSLTYSEDLKEKGRMKIWHYQLSEYIKQHDVSEEIMNIFAFLNTYILLLTDYEMLFLKEASYLFPYPKVVKGSRIIVYGAGKLGAHMIRALDKRDDYEIVLWVDQNEKRPDIPGYNICPTVDILKVEFDFVVVAVVFDDLKREIKEYLLNMDIPEEKIAIMDPAVITKEYLERVFEEN